MKRLIIDTNALISFVTDRNPEQQEKIAKVFKAAASLKHQILCHQHVISEFVYVMGAVYAQPSKKINIIVRELILMPGIQVSNRLNINRLLDIWPACIEDFGDAQIASYALETERVSVATFDKKFIKSLKTMKIPVFDLFG